jgi:hypothetical protein
MPKVSRLFATPQNKNVHAHFVGGSGWIKVKPDKDDGVTNVAVLLAAARASDRDIAYNLENGQIKDVYF